MESTWGETETYTSFAASESDDSFDSFDALAPAEADDEGARSLARLGAFGAPRPKPGMSGGASPSEPGGASPAYFSTGEARASTTGDLAAGGPATNLPDMMDAPAETAPVSERDALAEYTEERAQIRHEMDGVKLLIKQSEQELTRLGDRKQEIADEVAAIEERLQHHTRDEIRDVYLRSNEIEMRVFMIKEELDKLKAKLKTTERYDGFLTRAIETLSTLPSPEQTQAAMDGEFFGVLTSGTLPPFLRDMAQRIATGDLPPKDGIIPPAGGIAPSLGQAASTRAVQAQEEVRARVAQQLHTTIMQGLVNLALATEICEKLVRTDPAASLEELDHLKALINATVQQASKTMLALRPLALEGQGLTATIQRFATTLAGEKGLSLTFSAPHAERKLAPDAAVAVFRVAQEALENVVRHSHATEVRVTVAFVPNGLSVTVEDDGVGVDVEQAMARAVQHQTAGIMGMLERAEMLGGWLRFESNPGKGASVEFYAPL